MRPPFSLFCKEFILVGLVMDLDFGVLWKGDQKDKRTHLHSCRIFVRIDMMSCSPYIGTCRWLCIWLLHQVRLHSCLTVWLLLWLWLRWLYFVRIRCHRGKVGFVHQWILRNTGYTLYFLFSGDISWWKGRCFVVGNWCCGVGCYEILWLIFMWR